MQITLTQQEIEVALRAHINSIIPISDDAKITLQDNGPDGFTASVDLDPDAKPVKATRQPRKQAEKPADAPAATETKPDKAESVEQAPAPETAQEATEAPAAEQATTVAGNTETAEQATDAAQPEQSSEADAAADGSEAESAPAEKTKSLFAGLAKPRNPA